MSVFDSLERTDASPSKYSETTYAFLCRVAGSFWDQCRTLIDQWLAEYPPKHRPALEGRLRSGDDRSFTSALWELYLHEMYRRDEWTIEIEPELEHTTTRPDFFVSKAGVSYYVEARCVFAADDAGAQARLGSVYDSINTINSGAFGLSVIVVTIGSQPPPTKKLKQELETWLEKLDPDADDYIANDEWPGRCYEWNDNGWHLRFEPTPRGVSARDCPARRPLAARTDSEISFIDDVTPFTKALSEKGGKYGDLDHPLVLAFNVMRDFHDEDDTRQALFGTERQPMNGRGPAAETHPVLVEHGYWNSDNGPAHTRVAGVLVAMGVCQTNVASRTPVFWPHPQATQGVGPLPLWGLASAGPDGITRRDPSMPASDYFGLPSGWPIGDSFPR